MTEKELGRFIDDICHYFERRKPNQNTMDLWFDKLKRIPAESLDYIKISIQSKAEFPRNLPEMTFAMFQLWLDRNPDKLARKEYRECPYCQNGILFLAKQESIYKAWMPVSANCGHCRQRQDEPKTPMLTKFQYQEMGLESWDDSMNSKVEMSPMVQAVVGKRSIFKSDLDLDEIVSQLKEQYTEPQDDGIPF